MINSIIDSRIPQPTATNQLLVWNNTTGLFEASVSLSGLTLIAPTIQDDILWVGHLVDQILVLQANEDARINFIGDYLTIDSAGDNYISCNAALNKIDFGNTTNDTVFNFNGFGTMTVEGNVVVENLKVEGGFIGDTDDAQLIEIDGAGGIVTVHGNLYAGTDVLRVMDTQKRIAVNTAGVNGDAFRVQGLTGVDGVNFGIGQLVVFLGGDGLAATGAGVQTGAAGGGGFFSGGVGGTASSSDGVATGGDGGVFQFIGGSGAQASTTIAGSEQGSGGSLSLIGGVGALSDGNNTGGAGGDITITGGESGYSFALGGQGGDVIITGGLAGYSDDVGTRGGNVTINCGGTSEGLEVPGNIFLGSTTGNVRVGDATIPTEAFEVAGNAVATGDVSGATLTAGDGFTGTGAYTTLTIVNGIITNAV